MTKTSVGVLMAKCLLLSACSDPNVSINDCGENPDPRERLRICTQFIDLAQVQSLDEIQRHELSTAYMSRANALQFLDQHPQAIDDLTRAMELNPRSIANYLLRASSYSQLENYDAAIKDMTDVMKINFRKPMFLNMRALQYEKKQEYALAIADYNESIERKPENVNAYIAKAKLLATAKDIEIRDPLGSLETAEFAVDLSRSDRTISVLALALAANNRFSEAATALEQAIALLENKPPSNPESVREIDAKKQRLIELENQLSNYRAQAVSDF